MNPKEYYNFTAGFNDTNITNSTNHTTITSSYSEQKVKPDQIIKLILGILAATLNGVLLAAMFKDRKKIFITRISYLVANLAIADCLTGLALIFIEPEVLRHKDTPKDLVDHKIPITWTPMTISFLTLFLMSAERLVVVALPMIWTRILTPRRTLLCIFVIWCIAFLFGYLLKVYESQTQLAISLIIIISALFFVGIHIYIVCLLRRRERQLSVQSESLRCTSGAEPGADSPAATTSTHAQSYSSSTASAHSKVTTVVAILILVLVITFFPHMFCLLLFTFGRATKTPIKIHDPAFFFLVYEYTDAFSYLNFVLNPIVYARCLRIYRKAFFGLLRCNKGE